MGFEIVAYDILKEKVQLAVSIYAGCDEKNGFNEKRVRKALLQVTDDSRRIQCQFMLKVVELLDDNHCPQQYIDRRDLILNGTVLYIQQQIEKTYKKSMNPLATVNNSDLYNKLTTALGITKSNAPQNDEVFQMYGNLEKFLRACAYNTVKGVCDPEYGHIKERPFNAIRGYSIDDDIIALSKQLFKLKEEKINYYRDKPEGKPKSKSNGLSAGFFAASSSSSTASSTAPEASTEADKEEKDVQEEQDKKDKVTTTDITLV